MLFILPSDKNRDNKVIVFVWNRIILIEKCAICIKIQGEYYAEI